MRNIKQVNIKNRTRYVFDDMINIKGFDPSVIKIDKKSYENIGIYNIKYITIKSISDCKNINSVNLLYLTIGEVNGYIEESNENKYLTFSSTDKHEKLLDEIKYHIQTKNADKSGEYEKHFVKIKFNSDLDLPLNKILKLLMFYVSYEPYLYHGCHDLMQKAMNFNVDIVSIKGND